MAVGVNNIVEEINDKLIACSSDQQQFLQLSASAAALQNSYYSVLDETSLPLANENTGRFVYVESLCDYRYSNGSEWTRNYDSEKISGNIAYSWGCNLNYGQLGINCAANQSSPVSVVGGLTDWCQVSAGTFNSGGIRSNGTLWMWGRGNNGQIGDNTANPRSSPISVAGGFNDWCQVSVARDGFHAGGIRTNGTLWMWGNGTQGPIGDGTTATRSSPVSVAGGFTDWVYISSGGRFISAVRSDGTIWAWGYGRQGQLGESCFIDRSSPVSVVGGFTDWCTIGAGYSHIAAIRTDGTAWAWGLNCQGQLGINSTINRSSPVSVVGGFTDWCQISAGYLHTAAIRTNGTLWAWGWNTSGQLGDNSQTNRSSPISIVGGFTNWCQLSSGHFATGAVRTNGELWMWGASSAGTLGDNTINSKSSPISVIGGINSWSQVSIGCIHVVAISSNEFIRGFDTL